MSQDYTTVDIIPKDGPPPSNIDAISNSTPSDPSQAAMQKLLGARLRCTLTDGRTATGTFICMDRLKNMILTNVLEERVIDAADYNSYDSGNNKQQHHHRNVPVQRELAQAMIPGKHLVKVEIDTNVYDLNLLGVVV